MNTKTSAPSPAAGHAAPGLAARLASARRALWVGLLCGLSGGAMAATVAPDGCPIFHCTTEATGVIDQALVPQILQVNSNSGLGALRGQGCSGDGTRLSCLFATDTATGPARGTLKVLDATTLQPIWGSAAAPNSYNLNATTAANGQVPLVLSDGTLVAGDASVEVAYGATGGVIGKLPLAGKGNNLGITPISDTVGVVSQTDGVLTLVNLSTWQAMGSLTLTDPTNGARIALVSPSSSSSGVLYAVGGNPVTKMGFLFSVIQNPTNPQALRLRWTYRFQGKSGASPVVVAKTVSNLTANLVLLHVQGLMTDPVYVPRLVGIKDMGSTPNPVWSVVLPQDLKVSPSVDASTQSLFLEFTSDSKLYQYNFLTGAALNTYDIRALGNFPSPFVLNGHLGALQANGVYTMLLAGAVTGTAASDGQYIIAFNPNAAPASLLWTTRIRNQADQYTAAWNLAPSSQRAASCPVVVGSSSGITRVCDY